MCTAYMWRLPMVAMVDEMVVKKAGGANARMPTISAVSGGRNCTKGAGAVWCLLGLTTGAEHGGRSIRLRRFIPARKKFPT